MRLEERLIAYAKINLELRVGDKIPAINTHILDSVFMRINLGDDLSISLQSKIGLERKIAINTSFDKRLETHLLASGQNLAKIKDSIQNDTALITRTINLVQESLALDFDVVVTLHKSIPIEAGLGGGSSDAASIINFFDKHFKLGDNKKLEIAEQIGSDVGPCMYIEPTTVRYYKTHSIKPIFTKILQYPVLIIKPPIGSNTKKAYSNLNRDYLESDNIIAEAKDRVEWLAQFFSPSGKEEETRLIENDFQNSIFKEIPELKLELIKLNKFSPLVGGLSGSGSSIFTIFNDYKSAYGAYNDCSNLINKGWFLSLNKIVCL